MEFATNKPIVFVVVNQHIFLAELRILSITLIQS